MSDNSPSQSSGGKSRSNKSVRWTGRDDHRESNNEDYFSFSGGSANQSSSYGSIIQEEDESSSSSEDSGDDDNDDVRATTRANTWFNRIRQTDSMEFDGEENSDDDDAGNSEHHHLNHSQYDSPHYTSSPYSSPGSPVPGPSTQNRNTSMSPQSPGSRQPPSLSIHDYPGLNPYAHLMDIGSRVSGGLAPGGTEQGNDHDPIDEEYRERRDRLLASVRPHSQPQSPEYEIRDPMDPEAIPMRTMAPPDYPNQSPPQLILPENNVNDGTRTPEIVVHDASEEEGSPVAQFGHPGLHVGAGIMKYTQEEAEKLRNKLQEKQSERVHRMEEIIHSRKNREEKRQARHQRTLSSQSERRSSHESARSNLSNKTSTSSQMDKDADASEEAELKLLEEANKQEAEDQAKLLVMAHLHSHNHLHPDSAYDGYTDSNLYFSDAMRKNDGLDVNNEEGDENKGGDAENSTDSTTSDEKGESNSKDSNADSSDSESDSDDDQDKHTMRGDPDYVPPPKKVKEGVLGSLLRLYAGQEDDDEKSISSNYTSPMVSTSTTPLASPGGTPPFSESSPNEIGSDSFDQLSGTNYTEDSSSVSTSVDSKKRWKRPSYFRTHSSEDALGRDSRMRQKWYKRPSYSRSTSISELASSGIAAAGNAAAGISHSIPHSHQSGPFKFKGKGPQDPAAIEAKNEKRAKDQMKIMADKEAKKQQKKLEQKEREKRKALKKARLAEQARITVHIADVLQRQRFILRLGRALMLFGAPSHRLEEYLKITARVLEIDAQFLYMPGTMLISFGDATTHTSETKLIRVTQGLNLTKLHATHLIYKEVVHDLMSLEEATSHIDQLLRSNNLYPWYVVVFFYGIACVCCGMFAYGAYWHDMPIIFLVGGGVGFLQFYCQPRSDLYANVFEVSSTVVVSLVGRAFGSIGGNKTDNSERVFCFAAITQASLALILPGYIILVGALELQTKNLVAGSVRMFYANIYSLFLSFGMTLGSTIFGWIDKHASTETTCHRKINSLWKILFVPSATLFMAVVNQAGPRQLPIMVIIGSAGYTVQYFVQSRVKNAASFTSAIGAFTMGVIGNLYSRVGHGLAFAAMLPGIFVLVPSGIAAQDSFVAGLQVASQIVNGSSSSSTSTSSESTSASISELGNSMTQVAVGIVVGLFAATLVVYPLGFKKKRSGLFTF